MCLSSVTKVTQIPKEKAIPAYKVFRVLSTGKLGPLFYARGKAHTPGRQYSSKPKLVRIYRKRQNYQTGYHTFVTKRAALRFAATLSSDVEIMKVLLWGNVTEGWQNFDADGSGANVRVRSLVGHNMKITKEVINA